jgi:hypothetical protein
MPMRTDEPEIVRLACAYNNYKWPENLTSGVMYYLGRKVTIEAFQEQVKLFRPTLT